MEKIDYKRKYSQIYTAAYTPQSIQVPELSYLTIDGKGDPNTSEEFKKAVEALFVVSYTLKFSNKKKNLTDFAVMPLEGLWWTDKMEDFTVLDKSNWSWTLLIMQPDFITKETVATVKEIAFKKKGNESIKALELRQIAEGTAAQILHVGPYSEEAENIEKLHAFIAEKGFTFDGIKQKHHEIYLSDMRKTPPKQLRTIIRQPYV